MKNRFFIALPVAVGMALSPRIYAENIEIIEVLGENQHASVNDDILQSLSKEGVDFSAAGGLSPLPILNGLMGDRIMISSDGVPITSACANQMNPPLSYTASSQLKHATISPTISKVSAGGDNIAGVIDISTFEPKFLTEQNMKFDGQLSYLHRHNDNANAAATSVVAANNAWFIRYAGQFEQADSYKNGNGDTVIDTLYEAQNHALGVAYGDENQELSLNLSYQSIPYQGFPNQFMDMTDNQSTGILVKYNRKWSKLALQAIASWRSVKHEMGFFTDEKTGSMPMNTESDDTAVKAKWTLPINDNSYLILGQEYYANSLQDWWPAVEGSMMMSPNDYINVNNGNRDRVALYAEWQEKAALGWYYSAGMRVEKVTTNTGDVQPYSDMNMITDTTDDTPSDSQAAATFNMQDRKQQDMLADVTLIATKQIDKDSVMTLGVARKNRAPNLYERYSWGRSTMATSMIGWFGDGNGYVGDINLKPETAHSADVRYKKSISSTQPWGLDIDVWYTKIDDYIDVEVIGTTNRTGTDEGIRHTLQFVNLDATLYGTSVSAYYELMTNEARSWLLSNKIKWQEGKRDEGDEYLYQLLPLRNTLSIGVTSSNWQTTLEWQWTAKKNKVDARRLENQTQAYSIFNLRSQYNWQKWTLTADISNLLDEQFELPLGGVNVAEFKRDSSQGFMQMEGRGRSVNIGFSYQF